MLEVTGVPEAMGYCHSRSWSGGPVNAFSLWKSEAVRVTAGAEHVASFAKTRAQPTSVLRHLMTDHPTLGLVDVFAATLPTLRTRDGLPKLNDFPTVFGGSGELVPD